MSPSQVANKYRPYLMTAVILLSVLFFIGGPRSISPRSFKAVWNIGHILYFALLPLLIFSSPKNRALKPIVQFSIIIGSTLTLGIFVELLQHGLNRTPDIGDIYRNMIGAMIAIFFLLPTKKSVPEPTLKIIRTITIIIAALQFYPIFYALYEEHQARQSFPVLSDFKTPSQLQRWTKSDNISIAITPDDTGSQSLKLELTTGFYSGTRLKYFPRNWEGYDYFQFRVYNPSVEKITLTCSIYDTPPLMTYSSYHDRYNKICTMRQGWNTITIKLNEVQQAPKSREMDLTQIYGISIFANRLPRPRTIYIDDLKLY